MPSKTFTEAVASVTAASDPTDLFGHRTSDGSNGRHRYLALVKLLHPDTVDAASSAAAHEVFAKLNRLWQDFRDDTHGTVSVGGSTYRLGRVPRHDDIAACYPLHDDAGRSRVELRLARDPADNDLIRAEAEALDRIAKQGDPRFKAYVPRPAATIRLRDKDTGTERCGNVLPRLHGFVSLRAVASSRPDGLDPRDVAWMWRRLLVALGHTHRAGIVHGAILPEHVLIHPEEHGLILSNWYYAVAIGKPLSAVVERATAAYPREVFDRAPAQPSLDIAMATTCMTDLIGARIPDRLRDFARGCAHTAPNRRPPDAWELLSELDEILDRLWGPRKFRPFKMTVN
ncbi:molecular chaperone DnaJ [Stackebrandtia soli]|uniref:molecular chaperone DnaJ n=1 Tax=Stackebrandtia soli TaxID=1892856 RepID=UPI0039EA9DC9